MLRCDEWGLMGEGGDGVGYNINNAALLYGLSDIWLSG